MIEIRTGMALAAGLGTRMRPLTNDRPKALVEVDGRTLLDYALDRMARSGVQRAVVNIHHFAERMEAHLAARTGDPEIIISDERDEVLETGGGVVKALPLLGEAPLHSVDQRGHVRKARSCRRPSLWIAAPLTELTAPVQ